MNRAIQRMTLATLPATIASCVAGAGRSWLGLMACAGAALVTPARALDIFHLDPAVNQRFLGGTYADGNLQVNPGFLLAGHDLSGLGWERGNFGVTLISPQHFVTAEHVAPPAGTTVSFLNRDGVIKHYVVESVHSIAHSVGVHTDLVVGRLTAPIPEADHIGYFPILRLATNDDYRGLQIYSFGIYQSCGLNTIVRWGNYDMLPFGRPDGVPDNIIFLTEWHQVKGQAQAQGNDSGSPSFVLHHNKLTLVGTHSAVNVNQMPYLTVDVLIPAYFTQIKALVAKDGFTLLNGADDDAAGKYRNPPR